MFLTGSGSTEQSKDRLIYRRAELADVPDMLEFKEAQWRAVYKDMIPQRKIDAVYSPESKKKIAAYWRQLIETGAHFWLAVTAEGDVVGLAQGAHSANAPCPTETELTILYVDSTHRNLGVATKLLELAVGNKPTFLWVLKSNESAIRFYERRGFVPDGDVRALDDDVPDVHEIRMVRK